MGFSRTTVINATTVSALTECTVGIGLVKATALSKSLYYSLRNAPNSQWAVTEQALT